jgi:hypothetical protein
MRLKVIALRASQYVPFSEYCQGDKIKEVKMGRACGMRGRKEIYMQDFGVKTWWKETALKI